MFLIINSRIFNAFFLIINEYNNFNNCKFSYIKYRFRLNKLFKRQFKFIKSLTKTKNKFIINAQFIFNVQLI